MSIQVWLPRFSDEMFEAQRITSNSLLHALSHSIDNSSNEWYEVIVGEEKFAFVLREGKYGFCEKLFDIFDPSFFVCNEENYLDLVKKYPRLKNPKRIEIGKVFYEVAQSRFSIDEKFMKCLSFRRKDESICEIRVEKTVENNDKVMVMDVDVQKLKAFCTTDILGAIDCFTCIDSRITIKKNMSSNVITFNTKPGEQIALNCANELANVSNILINYWS